MLWLGLLDTHCICSQRHSVGGPPRRLLDVENDVERVVQSGNRLHVIGTSTKVPASLPAVVTLAKSVASRAKRQSLLEGLGAIQSSEGDGNLRVAPWAILAWKCLLIWHWQGKLIDRKSTRLNSSHLGISYAVFFLKK